MRVSLERIPFGFAHHFVSFLGNPNGKRRNLFGAIGNTAAFDKKYVNIFFVAYFGSGIQKEVTKVVVALAHPQRCHEQL